jgi:hypothetical protein
MKEIRADTGYFWWTFEVGMAQISKEEGYFRLSNISNGFKAYETLIKGAPVDPNKPEECWAVTNRYDPRIVKAFKNNDNELLAS